jgi:hypothetical protein
MDTPITAEITRRYDANGICNGYLVTCYNEAGAAFRCVEYATLDAAQASLPQADWELPDPSVGIGGDALYFAVY